MFLSRSFMYSVHTDSGFAILAYTCLFFSPPWLVLIFSQIRSVVLEGSRALLDAGRQCGYLTEVLTTSPSQSMLSHECRLAALCDMAKQLPLTDESEEAPVQTLNRDGLDPTLDLFSYITENPSDCAYEVTLMKEKYLLPPRSRFLLSDITRIHPVVNSEFNHWI